MRPALTFLAGLALFLTVPTVLTVPPATAQQDQSSRLVGACMEAEADQAYCQCASNLLLMGLTPEEMSMFLAYMETDNEQDSDFLYSLLPGDKIAAIFDTAEAQCRGNTAMPAMQGNEKQRMIDQCRGFDEEPGYCDCAVDYLEQRLTPDEFLTMLLSMEAETPEQEELYLAGLDQARMEKIFNDADQTCATVAETMPTDDQQNVLTDAKVRMVRFCEDEGEAPGDCQCFANEMAARLSPEEMHMLLDAVAAEDSGDTARADWLRQQLDETRLNQAFEHVEQACGIDF